MNLGALRINDTDIFFREINTETTNNYIYLLILFFYLFYFIYLLFRNLYLIYFVNKLLNFYLNIYSTNSNF